MVAASLSLEAERLKAFGRLRSFHIADFLLEYVGSFFNTNTERRKADYERDLGDPKIHEAANWLVEEWKMALHGLGKSPWGLRLVP